MEIHEVLESLEKGKISVNNAKKLLSLYSIEEIEGIAKIDINRRKRRGIPEVIFAETKKLDEIKKIVKRKLEKTNSVVVSRINNDDYSKILSFVKKNKIRVKTGKYSSSLLLFNKPIKFEGGKIGILTAGTSHIGIAEEARLMCEAMNCKCISSYDVGVAGIERMEPLRRVASEMELEAQFDQGMQATMQELGERARQQAQELRRLRQDLADRDEQLAAVQAQVQRLDARLGGVSEERVALQRRIDAQERLRASVASIESTFTPDEARVFRQGDDVVLSLLGIRFPSGRSTIDSKSSALMRKVEQALRLFPGASVSVEGHTDANGSYSTNLILSQDRADAVKQYLIRTLGLDPEKVSSVAYGEARPVATNESPEGRAPNRRIDLIIHGATR